MSKKPAEPAIAVSGVSKKFGKIRALDGVSIEVEKGEIFGLLGPNGAGKTTLINILTGLLLPDGGTAQVAGIDVVSEPDAVQARLGYLSGYTSFCGTLTGAENLKFYSMVRGKTYDRSLVKLFGMEARIDSKTEEYSMGMLQRLGLIHALIGRPQILLLDEPTIGLDPDIARTVRSFVLKLNRAGATVLLTTHNMAEAEQLCDRIAFINKGRIVATGTARQLTALVRKRRATLEDAFIHLTGGRLE